MDERMRAVDVLWVVQRGDDGSAQPRACQLRIQYKTRETSISVIKRVDLRHKERVVDRGCQAFRH